nr:ammonium transporter [uncultured Blautia sp.]
MSDTILQMVNENIFGVWFLAGAVLVFWMQAGFAMVETGFTRAKNAGNILMKNLMDFCIGTILFIFIGYSLLSGTDVAGFLGKPQLSIFTSYSSFNWSDFVFNLVFCATTATIVSGAMAERTRFLSYCIYSAVISGLIYPIEAHWIWGGGWLAQRGFHDFAGSCAIHMVGGICAFIGAAMLGPRIGKYPKNKWGKIVRVNAFPGHNLPIGCLGVFILWMGWYGFNGAAAKSVEQLGSIFLTTTVAPAVATVVCMVFTWIRYGKPDVTMCLNAALAGLVAITASCDSVDCLGSLIIGAISGLLVVWGVWFLDHRLRVDDPVGAVAVHMLNGIWGTLAVGLFATDSVPEYSIADSAGKVMTGLFYGGGLKLFGIQFLGFISVAAYTAAAISVSFFLIKKTVGLRVPAKEEMIGLDQAEHGLATAYAGFSVMDIDNTMEMAINDHTVLSVEDEGIKAAAIPAVKISSEKSTGIYEVIIITRLVKFDELKKALNDLGVTGMTVTQVMGCGIQKGANAYYRGVEMDASLLPKVKVDVVVGAIPVDKVIQVVRDTLYTGNIGDGKIFVYEVEKVVKVRTGEENMAALQDVE